MIRAATGTPLDQSAPGAARRTAYDEPREALCASAVVNINDTGWRIGGAAAFLMGFFTPLLAMVQIRWRHRHQEAVEMPGVRFSGLLGTDPGVSYEAGSLDAIEQQKCLSHLLKNLSAAEEAKTDRAKALTRE